MFPPTNRRDYMIDQPPASPRRPILKLVIVVAVVVALVVLAYASLV